MASFEQAFSEMERAAASTAKSAAALAKLAKALEKAAKDGNIAAAKRAQANMDEAMSTLRQEVANSVESGPLERKKSSSTSMRVTPKNCAQ